MVAIFVVLTILICVSADLIIQKRKQKQPEPAPAGEPEPGGVRSFSEGLALPSGLFAHSGHTWAELQPSGAVRVGLDDFVMRALGPIDRVELLDEGKPLQQGAPMLVLEQQGRRICLPAPLSGTVQTVNKTLDARPDAIQTSPYRNGWVYSLTPARLGTEIGSLKLAETAQAWLKDEVQRFTDWLTNLGAAQPVPALPDGGQPTVGVLSHLGQSGFSDFQKQFLGDFDREAPLKQAQ